MDPENPEEDAISTECDDCGWDETSLSGLATFMQGWNSPEDDEAFRDL